MLRGVKGFSLCVCLGWGSIWMECPLWSPANCLIWAMCESGCQAWLRVTVTPHLVEAGRRPKIPTAHTYTFTAVCWIKSHHSGLSLCSMKPSQGSKRQNLSRLLWHCIRKVSFFCLSLQPLNNYVLLWAFKAFWALWWRAKVEFSGWCLQMKWK